MAEFVVEPDPVSAVRVDSDAAVMLRVKQGDDAAFNYLVQKYRRAMLSFMFRMAHNAAAAAPTTGVIPAAADEVSALTAAQFVTHAQMYHAVSARAAAIHQAFVTTLATCARSYAATEAANAAAAG